MRTPETRDAPARSSTGPRLLARGVGVRFGEVQALDDVTCTFGGRGVTGLIGMNGAGKTTLVHALTGLLAVTSGSVALDGDLDEIAYCPDTPTFEPWLTAAEVLVHSSRLGRRGDTDPDPDRIRSVLDRVGLDDAAHRRVGGYSRGMSQRLGIAAALVRDPGILLLDEPTSALDPVGRADVMALVTELGHDLLVVFSSHILDDVERVADDLVVLHRGAVVHRGPMGAFRQQAGVGTSVLVTLAGTDLGSLDELDDRGVAWTADPESDRRVLVVPDDLPTVLDVLSTRPDEVVAVERQQDSLQAAFLAAIRAADGHGGEGSR